MPRRGAVPIVPRISSEAMAAKGLPLTKLYAEFMRVGLVGRARSTVRNHRRSMELARSLPEHPTPADVMRWRAALVRLPAGEGRCMAESTAQVHCWNVERVYQWGSDAGLSQGNPVRLCEFTPPDPAPRAIRAIGRAWAQILATARTDRERSFLAVLRFLGLRLGEALGLRAEDVQVDARGRPAWLSVTRQRHPASLTDTADLKGGYKSHRTVPVRPELAPLLRRVLGLGDAEVWVGRGGQRRASVPWLHPFRPADLQALRGRLRAALPLCFPRGDAFHVLRHSLAAELGDAGKDISEVQAVLGHASPETTTHYMSALVGQRVRREVFAGLDPPRKKRPPNPGAAGTGVSSNPKRKR